MRARRCRMTTRCSVGNEMPRHNDERCGQRDAAWVTRYSTGNEMGLDDKTQCRQQDALSRRCAVWEMRCSTATRWGMMTRRSARNKMLHQPGLEATHSTLWLAPFFNCVPSSLCVVLYYCNVRLQNFYLLTSTIPLFQPKTCGK